MLTSPVFRHAKPSVSDITAMVPKTNVIVTTTTFSNRTAMAPKNRALFDVVAADGRVLSREEGLESDYWFESGDLVVRTPGTYTVRNYPDVAAFENTVIKLGKNIVMSDGGAFRSGIPFWPEILSQHEGTVARVSNDGRNIAFCSLGLSGKFTFGYRLRNAYGQVSEPACVTVTAA